MTDIITSFRELIVWQKSMDLAVRAYNTAKKLPSEDLLIRDAQEIGKMINGLVRSLERGKN
jgi:23S rRNA-intervening sequence protein